MLKAFAKQRWGCKTAVTNTLTICYRCEGTIFLQILKIYFAKKITFSHNLYVLFVTKSHNLLYRFITPPQNSTKQKQKVLGFGEKKTQFCSEGHIQVINATLWLFIKFVFAKIRKKYSIGVKQQIFSTNSRVLPPRNS